MHFYSKEVEESDKWHTKLPMTAYVVEPVKLNVRIKQYLKVMISTLLLLTGALSVLATMGRQSVLKFAR